jgi:plasmid stabilization system protein ParE
MAPHTGKRKLEAIIYMALKQAAAENRLDVAEYLLQALEILAEEPYMHPPQPHHH